MLASGFSWFRLIPAVDDNSIFEAIPGIDPEHTVVDAYTHLHAWLSVAVLLGLALIARNQLERVRQRSGLEKYFSDDKPTVLATVEVFAEGIKGLMSDLLGPKDVKYYFPFIAGLFAYILFCNLQGILPGFLPPTDVIDTNVGMAVSVFLLFNAVGLYRDPVGYLRHLGGPVLALAPFMFVVESISLFIRPVSLTIRLTANMFGDHQVFTVLSGLVPVILPAALLILATLVSFIQAFVFSLLTVIYINLSLPHDEHEAH
ncbi:MAG: F0F1 ATP synthase subunit A [Myxococcota bacterium]